ncbi:MAG TPA: BatA and WFA domain-containing protein [Longimicrobiales bacterium]|nr:BatA and WFA domain-containing protein [Longimicrobiales bacterium]
MGALNPLFLIASLGVGVPLFLHLFHRQQARRLTFPALRYLQRTEREHARKIKARQIVLLLLRIAAIVLLVGAGARLFLRGPGAAHAPTALAIVLDNSLSSGLVRGQERTLDHLKAVALRSLAVSNEADRIWVIRAGEPWQASVPGTPDQARRLIEQASPTAARGDLSAALVHAMELVSTADMRAAEIHLISDLQATAFSDVTAPAGEVPVVVWAAEESPVENRGIVSVVVGGGLPPLQGQRTEITLQASRAIGGDTVPIPVRFTLDGRIRGAGAVPPGASLALPLPSAPAGWVLGTVDADPDDLSGDDRRYFAFRARPAPTVAVAGDPGLFVTEAVGVLEAAGRLSPAAPGHADALISAGGEALADLGAGGAVLVVPPSDPTALPALNRRLASAGIPWRYDRAQGGGAVRLEGEVIPEPLREVRTRVWYRLVLAGDPPAPTRTLAQAGGEPWAIEGSDGQGRRYLLLASPLDPEASSLPVSADMIRFVDWFTGQWAAPGGGAGEVMAGDPLAAPRSADAVRLPSGTELPVDGTRMLRATGEAGFYTFLTEDSVVSVEAVNPPPSESDLTPLDATGLRDRIGREVTVVRRSTSWDRAVFGARQGPELWQGLLVAGLLVLLVEAAVAASGPLWGRRRSRAEVRGEGAGVSA